MVLGKVVILSLRNRSPGAGASRCLYRSPRTRPSAQRGRFHTPGPRGHLPSPLPLLNMTSHPPPHSIFSLFQFSPCLKQILAASRLCLWGPPLIFQHSSTIDFNFMSWPGGLLLLSVLSQFGNVLSFPVLVYRLHATVFFYVMADFWRLTSDGWLYTEPSPETHVRLRWRLRHDCHWTFVS